MLKIGSHIGMSGKEMFLGSAKEAVALGENTFMIYTGAPQNTRRKAVEELNIKAGWDYLHQHGINEIIIHAPYIINLGNSVKEETYSLAVQFLEKELERTKAMGSRVLVLHPGSQVGKGVEAGTKKIIQGLNSVMSENMGVYIALETMAGKGSEIGRSFEELAAIYDGVIQNQWLRVCFDTCHTNDAGYDIVHDFDGVMDKFDRILGKDQIAVFHINDSKNPRGAAKDRHSNVGYGTIGFEALDYIVHHKDFQDIPKILETPYIPDPKNPKKSAPPYKYEIQMLRDRKFHDYIREDMFTAE